MENSIKNERSSIEEDIKIALDKFSDNKDIDSAILIVEKFILGNYILRGGRKNIVKDSLRYILSDYKRVLKENEILKEEKEQAWEEWNNLEQGSYETEQKLKQQIKELRKENEEKDKIIDLLIKELYTKAHISTRCYLQTSTEECMKYKNCYECLKKYFEKKVKG